MPQQIRAEGRCVRLRLLGRWQLVVDGADVELGHREERLAALLGLAGRTSRLRVAGILWPESTDVRALASLRRAVLQTQKRSPGLLQADRLTIGLDPGVEVDVDDVRRAAAATEEAMASDGAAALLDRLVGEELLPGWYDEWVLPERERLEQLRVKAFERISRHALAADDLLLTVEAARAASDIDPLLESASELAIRAHLDRGDVGSAVREFDRYRDAMRDELDAPPARAIVELIEPARTPVAAPPVSERPDPPVRYSVPVPVPVPIPAPPAPPRPVEPPAARGSVARLVAVVALILAAAAVLAGIGSDRGGQVGDQVGPSSAMRVLPADDAIRAGQMVVRLVDATAGRAAFVVRTTLRPALVRLEVRGVAGTNVVRSLLVRSAQGRRLELSGLQPGRYRWLASSSVASTVRGRLRVPDQPVTPEPDTSGGDAAVEAAGPTQQPTVEQPTVQQSTVQQSVVQQSDQSERPDPAPERTPESSPESSPEPSPEPRPTGQPNDPGVEPPNPVG